MLEDIDPRRFTFRPAPNDATQYRDLGEPGDPLDVDDTAKAFERTVLKEIDVIEF